MCDFHSCIVYRDGTLFHLANNSHTQEAEASGRRENQPNREPFFVEAEWDGESPLNIDSIIRGIPNEKQRMAIERHYTSLRDLLSNPGPNQGMLWDSGRFSGEEYADIRWRVLNIPNLDHRLADRLAKTRLYADSKKPISSLHPNISKLDGNLDVYGSAQLDAPALTEVSGNLGVYGSAKLDALTKVSGNLDVYGSAKLDAPALTEVSGNLDVYGSAQLDAPALTEVSGNLGVSGSAKLDALTKVSGNLGVSGSAQLDALTKVSGNLGVYGSAQLDAPALTEVSGNLGVKNGAELIAPFLKKKIKK